MEMTISVLHSRWRFTASLLYLLLALALAACNSGGNPPAGSGNGHASSSSAGIQLGTQPCPSPVKEPVHWNAIVGLAADQTIGSVTCGNLIGSSALQALVTVRH